jgi:hypothetical protein
MITVKFPPYLRCSIVILNSSGAFPFLKVEMQQSYLQKGFTKGESPSIAGLVLSELNIEAKEKRNPVYIALTDAKKAFDKAILKMFNSNFGFILCFSIFKS